MQISLANISDINGLIKCNKDVLPVCYSYLEYLYFIINGNYEVVMIKDDNNIIGFLLGTYETNETNETTNFHIMSIGIIKSHRKLGYGSKLLEWILNRIKELYPEYKSVSLYVHTLNKAAIKFYNKHGFKIKKTLYNYYRNLFGNSNDNNNAYLMSMPL